MSTNMSCFTIYAYVHKSSRKNSKVKLFKLCQDKPISFADRYKQIDKIVDLVQKILHQKNQWGTKYAEGLNIGFSCHCIRNQSFINVDKEVFTGDYSTSFYCNCALYDTESIINKILGFMKICDPNCTLSPSDVFNSPSVKYTIKNADNF